MKQSLFKLVFLYVIVFVLCSVELKSLKHKNERCGKHYCLPGLSEANVGINLVTGEFTVPIIKMTKGGRTLRDYWRNKVKKKNLILKKKRLGEFMMNFMHHLMVNRVKQLNYLKVQVNI